MSRNARSQLQQLLPTCQRCRRLRRKCDTQLPHCGPCQRAGDDCLLFDYALKQTLPRAYVQSLLTRVEHLEAVKAGGGSGAVEVNGSPSGTSGTPRTTAATPPSRTTVNATNVTTPSSATTLVTGTGLVQIQASPIQSGQTQASQSQKPTVSYDVVVPSASSSASSPASYSSKSRYWGSSSVFALTVEILQHATARGLVTTDDLDGPGPYDEDAEMDAEADVNTTNDVSAATEADIRALLQLYLVSSNTLYGFVDPDQVQADLDVYLAVRRQRQSPSPSNSNSNHVNTTPADPHPYFRIAMMCAIACATRARYRPQRTAASLAYYAAAVPFVEEVTAAVSPASLQALLLLILFCLFFPRKGDVWKLLDYACRLALELGYHTEGTDGAWAGEVTGAADAVDPPAENDNDSENNAQKLRRSTFWGLYAIERIVGQLFGRGSDLPESIITVAYPSALVSAAATSPGVDRAALQAMSIAHHYRLVYLRSEIFRTLYLPAGPLPVDLGWLREQYRTLHAWRGELTLPEGDQRDGVEGVATLTCDVGYDATMCFLFQPLLLWALREAGKEGNDNDSTPCVASDPFYSSLRLIRTYEKIVRAPETSVLGSYPMTFMSAHYIYLASSTLLAYALLRLDGRTRTLRRMGDGGDDENSDQTEEDLDWGVYVDASSSCLILLAWCGERWPGMLGMLGVYQRLFAKTIRELIGRGILR